MHGTPTKVPTQNRSRLTDDDHQLSHGSNDSTGGDAGNQYQTLWMTLACLNGVYAQELSFKEIILEGHHEPYDDIEIRKKDGSYTFFQSKHRDQKGSNNITISELISDTSGAFSLPKYFKGMMAELNKETDLDKCHFIIGVSASFSTQFQKSLYTKKATKDRTRITLEKNTWTTKGILQTIPATDLDPLLTTVCFSNGTNKSIADDFEVTPQYVRFSDNFIAGKHITTSQKTLREIIFHCLKEYIKKEKNADWMPENAGKNPVPYIKQFLKNLQWWINQPKVKKLQAIVQESLDRNFSMGGKTIYQHFFTEIKNSAKRNIESLDTNAIIKHLQAARGLCLTQEIRIRSGDYRTKNHLETIAINKFLFNEKLMAFLTGDNQVCLLYSNTPLEIKYSLHSTLIKKFENFDDWCLVDAETKPIFDKNNIDGIIDHGINDMVKSNALKIIALDNADKLLPSASPQLIALCDNSDVKIILTCAFENLEALQKLLSNKNPLSINSNISLTQKQANTIISTALSKEKQIQPLQRMPVNAIQLAQHLIAEEMLLYPSLLSSFLADIESDGSLKAWLPEQFTVEHYQDPKIKFMRPYYAIEDVLAIKDYDCICVEDTSKNVKKYLKKQTKIETFFGKNTNYLYYKINENKKLYLYLRHHAKKGPNMVSVNQQGTKIEKKINRENINYLPSLSPQGFLEKSLDLKEPIFLLKKQPAPQRILVSATYGMGKSCLLKRLFGIWHNNPKSSENYRWVIPCKLTDIAKNPKQELLPTIIKQLINHDLLKDPISPWVQHSLEQAIKQGNILLLLDSWDELYEEQYKPMDTWLNQLPKNISIVLASRPHAIHHLTIPFHQKSSLHSLDLKDIKQYTHHFFNGIDNKFTQPLFKWLGNGKKVTLILSRPLHLILFLTALQPYADKYTAANTSEEKAKIINNISWYKSPLYCTKLYQIIITNQLNQYLDKQVGANPLAHISKISGINLLTQAHQLYLREIAFERIFEIKAIPLVTCIDKKILIQELYNLGILSFASENPNEINFVYRIFTEYFAAQYLLNAFCRGSDDFIGKKIISLIKNHAIDPKYQQIWEILGEMIRYGEPLLDFEGIGEEKDVFKHFSFFEDDLFGSYYRYLQCSLNGIEYDQIYDIDAIRQGHWFEKIKKDNMDNLVRDPQYEDKSLDNLLTTARNNKNEAKSIIKYLIQNNKITDGWLKMFYLSDSKFETISTDTITKILTSIITANLNNLKISVNQHSWPNAAWGGYWDVDVYLPIIRHMHPKIYIMGAAYFIHRVEDKNNTYFSTGIPLRSFAVIHHLIHAEIDVDSHKLLYMMILTWLNEAWMFEYYQSRKSLCQALIPVLLTKIMTSLSQDDNELKCLSMHTLFALSRVFKLRMEINPNDNKDFQLIIKAPVGNEIYSYNITDQDYQLLTKQLNALKEKTNFSGEKLIIPQLDGSDLVLEEEPQEDIPIHAMTGLKI